jgi:exodeoxyribonuclease VII large subunit
VIDIPNNNVYTVGQVNSYIKNMFTQDYLLQSLFVKGEVSNCKYHSSGHIYFTLKENNAALACVMFAGSRQGLNFRLEDGQQVVVCGTVDVYERDGKYQLYAKHITLDGAGLLYERMEALKNELREQGMFAPEYKQPIPKYIKTLGVVTADTGAAVRDIIQIASRRNPYVQIILYPAIVQGEAAAPSIIKGIRALEHYGVDVMIVGRGGGSIEDLWAFNEREVAQAVFDCTVPIISAVGHETDTTIIDYVSDLRAPTPSAAAELAVTDIRDILGTIEDYREELFDIMRAKIRNLRDRNSGYAMRLKYLSPAGQIREKKQYAVQLEDRLNERMQALLRGKRQELAIYIEKMKGLSPVEKLNSGFSYVRDENGNNIRSVSQVKKDDLLSIHVRDGVIKARVD